LAKRNSPALRVVTPDEALEFLESFRKLMADQDEPTKLISIRIPENMLKAFKIKAKTDGKKYQSLLVEILRKEMKSWR
jgi:predicted DNA binding CopG/RHH family protein